MRRDSASAHFTDTQVARMLGMNPASVRRWRVKNKKAGGIKFGPPYEIHGSRILYPKVAFREWCAQVKVVDGVPCMNAPVRAQNLQTELESLVQQSTVISGET